MFDSLNGGYIPVCVLVLITSWFVAKINNFPVRAIITFIAPILVSLAWFFIPHLLDLFRPLKYGEDPWVGWGIITAATWSIVAIPVSVISVIIFVANKRHDKPDK